MIECHELCVAVIVTSKLVACQDMCIIDFLDNRLVSCAWEDVICSFPGFTGMVCPSGLRIEGLGGTKKASATQECAGGLAQLGTSIIG